MTEQSKEAEAVIRIWELMAQQLQTQEAGLKGGCPHCELAIDAWNAANNDITSLIGTVGKILGPDFDRCAAVPTAAMVNTLLQLRLFSGYVWQNNKGETVHVMGYEICGSDPEEETVDTDPLVMGTISYRFDMEQTLFDMSLVGWVEQGYAPVMDHLTELVPEFGPKELPLVKLITKVCGFAPVVSRFTAGDSASVTTTVAYYFLSSDGWRTRTASNFTSRPTEQLKHLLRSVAQDVRQDHQAWMLEEES